MVTIKPTIKRTFACMNFHKTEVFLQSKQKFAPHEISCFVLFRMEDFYDHSTSLNF